MKAFYTLIVVLHFGFAVLLAEDPYSINQNKTNLQNLNFVNENVGWVFNVQYRLTEILKTTDGGKNWFVQKRFIVDSIYEVSHVKFIDENNGFFVYKTSSSIFYLYSTEDGGDNWTEISLPSTKEVKSINFFNKDIFWLSQDGLYKTIDGGKSWHLTHDNSFEFRQLQFNGLTDGWALDNYTLIITTDAGLSWNKTNHKFGKIQLIDGITGYASKNDSLFRTDNFGTSWKLVSKIENYYHYTFLSKNVGFYISDGGLFKTTNGGKSWFLYNQEKFGFVKYNRYNEFAISIISDISIALLQDKARIHLTQDDGKTWESKSLGTYLGIWDIKGIDDKKLIVCGDDGLIGRTTDGGEFWDFRNEITHHNLNKIQIINNTVYIQGDSATFLKSTDFGENWQKLQLPNTYIFREDWPYFPDYDNFHFRDENNGWIVSKGGNAFKTTNGGNDWELVKIPCLDSRDVLFVDENRGFILGTIGYSDYFENGTFLTTTNGGKDWQSKTIAMDRFIHFDQTYLLITGGGTLYKYNINERTFESIYDKGMQDLEGYHVLDFDTIWGWSTQNVTCSFYKTFNGGKDWNFIRNNCNLPEALYFTDVNNGWMVYGNAIMKTNNGGYRALLKPIQRFPANNSTIPKDSVILKFNLPDYNGIRIGIQIAEDSSFLNQIAIIGEPTQSGYGGYYEPHNLILYKKYYWRLRVTDHPILNNSPWSEIWSFDIRWGKNSKVKLISPLGVETKTILLDLKWNKLEYAEYYRVQLSRDSTFHSLDLDSITSSDIIQKAKFLKTNETYYWRVKAYNSVDSTVWSDVGYFKSMIVSSVNVNDYSELIINPNPASDFITIQLSNKGLKPFVTNDSPSNKGLKTFVTNDNVQIFDMLGIEVMSETIHPMTASHRMNIEKLPAGVYFIRIGTRVEKFVKM